MHKRCKGKKKKIEKQKEHTKQKITKALNIYGASKIIK